MQYAFFPIDCTAEAGPYAAGHMGLQGNLAVHFGLLTSSDNVFHHEMRAAGVDLCHFRQDKVKEIRDKPFIADTAIIGCPLYGAAQGSKFIIQRRQLIFGPGTEKYMIIFGLAALPVQLFGQKQERGNAHTASDQTDRTIIRKGKAVTQGADQIQLVADTTAGQHLGSFTEYLEEQRNIAISKDTMNGQRTPKQGIKTLADPNHDKLAGPGMSSDLLSVQSKAKNIGCQAFLGKDTAFLLEFRHKKSYY
jgi:hypothetical protein